MVFGSCGDTFLCTSHQRPRAALPSLRSPVFLRGCRSDTSLPRGAAPSSVPNSLPCSHCPDRSRGPISTAKNRPRRKICHLMVQDLALSASLAQGQRPNPTGQGWRLAPGWLFGEVAQPPSPHPWPSPCREWEGPGRLAAVLGRDAGPAPALQQCLGEALASVGSVGCRPHPSSSGASRPPQTKLETNEASGQWDWLRKKKIQRLEKNPCFREMSIKRGCVSRVGRVPEGGRGLGAVPVPLSPPRVTGGAKWQPQARRDVPGCFYRGASFQRDVLASCIPVGR